MAGLAEAGSVIAVIQISTKVISLCTQYSREVLNARDDIARLSSSIISTRVELEGIERLLKISDNQGHLKVSQQLSPALSKCQSELEELQERLEPGKPRKARKAMHPVGKRALKWPFKSKEINRLMKDFERFTQTFTNAVVVDQTTILLENSRKADANLRDATLSKLPVVGGASYDAHDEEFNATCLGDTRIEIRDRISSWAVDPNGKCIFWLNGRAGTGKSTIARTVAGAFAERGILGASFFFKRGAGDRASGSRLFTTIAWQLAVQFPALSNKVAEAICADANVPRKSFKEQFEKLIIQPLCTPDLHGVPDTVLLVIDAIDECERDEDIRAIVKLLALAKDATSTRFRIFLTSRPELAILLGFKKLSASTYDDFILHEVAASTVERDIEVFLRHEFNEIREWFELDTGWPEESDIKRLARLAVPLFIFAATVYRYLRDSAIHPKKQLEYFLTSAMANTASGMEKTYLPVLHRLLDGKSETDQAQVIRNFRETVGAIVLLESPLSKRSLAVLLRIDEADVQFRLRQLHSILDIPSDPTVPIRLFHKSLRDFLLHPENEDNSKFWVNEAETHKILADCCISLLTTSPCLKQDICDKKQPGVQISDIAKADIDEALPPEVQYACRYWVHHLKDSVSLSIGQMDLSNVFDLLCHRFLYWLEALSVMGHVHDSIDMIQTLQSVPQMQNHPQLLKFVQDARRFLMQNMSIIAQYPLQLYSSALLSSPERSVVKTNFRELIPRWISQVPCMHQDWSACLQTLEGHSSFVSAVTFSKDGQMMASGSDDDTVKLWDVSAGGELHKTLEGHAWTVNSVVFSPDGRMVASGSHDRTIKLWDISTGRAERSTPERHSGRVHWVTFLLDGLMVASESGDGLKLWDASTGLLLDTIQTNDLRFEVSYGHPRGRDKLQSQLLSRAISHNTSFPLPMIDIKEKEPWISWEGRNLLWLPVEHRPQAPKRIPTAVHGSTVVLGNDTGYVMIVNFDVGLLP